MRFPHELLLFYSFHKNGVAAKISLQEAVQFQELRLKLGHEFAGSIPEDSFSPAELQVLLLSLGAAALWVTVCVIFMLLSLHRVQA